MTTNTRGLFRSLRNEALLQAGYERCLSPEMKEVVLETADEIYEDLLEDYEPAELSRNRRDANHWRPSLSV